MPPLDKETPPRKEDKRETDGGDAIDRHRLFSALLFGHPHHLPQEDAVNNINAQQNQQQQQHPVKKGENSSFRTLATNQLQDALDQSDTENYHDKEAVLTDRLEGVLTQIEQQIPHDPKALRQTTLYQGALQMLQWQRDNYLVGTEYADWQRQQQQQQQHQTFAGAEVAGSRYDIPYDPTALSHAQIAKLASDFIPAPTVVRALTPIVAGLPAGGVLFDPVRNATVHIIQGQRSNLEDVIKNRLLQFLTNPQNRAAMKISTQGMLVRRTNTSISSKNENMAPATGEPGSILYTETSGTNGGEPSEG